MPLSNSLPTSPATVPKTIPPVLPDGFNRAMSQDDYLSAPMMNPNPSRLAPSSQALVSSGFSQVLNDERSEINPVNLYDLSDFASETLEAVYAPYVTGNNNRTQLSPPASRANDLISAQNTSRDLMLSDFSEVLNADTMAEINRASLFDFSDPFAPHSRDAVCSTFSVGNGNNIPLQFPDNNNIPLEFPGASWVNDLIPAQQTPRALLSSDHSQVQNAERMGRNDPPRLYDFSDPFGHRARERVHSPFSAINMIPLQSSDRFQVQNAEGMGRTNHARLFDFSGPFPQQNREMLYRPFATNNMIPLQPPVSGVNPIPAPRAPVTPSSSDILTEIANHNVDSQTHPLSYPPPSVNGRSDLRQTTVDLPRREYQCRECPSVFYSPQAFGGHMSCHAKEKRKLEEFAGVLPAYKRLNLMPGPSGSAQNECGLGAYKEKGFFIGESSGKNKNKEHSP